MDEDISRVLVNANEIKDRVSEIAEEIDRDYLGRKLLLVGILRGAFVFLADIAKQLKGRFAFDFVSASSYGSVGTESNGRVELLKGITDPVDGLDILVVDDILDTGATLSFVTRYIKSKGARSVKICTLLNKPDRRKVPIKADYLGFTIPDEFVVGYGLGYNGEYRNLPYVGVLKDSVWKS